MTDWTALHQPSAIIDALDALSRTRALTLDESLALEQAIKLERLKGRRGSRWWSPEQDAIALEMKRRKAGVAMIAKRAGRSRDAVNARIRYLNSAQSKSSPSMLKEGE